MSNITDVRCFLNGNPNDYYYLPKVQDLCDKNGNYLGTPLSKDGKIKEDTVVIPEILLYDEDYWCTYDAIIDGLITDDDRRFYKDPYGSEVSINKHIEEHWDAYKAIVDSGAYTKENGFDVKKIKEVLAKLNAESSSINGNDASQDLQSENNRDIKPTSNNTPSATANNINNSGNVSTSVASMTTKIPTPPENINKPLANGFIPDGKGNVSIDLSEVASVAEPTVNEAMMNMVNPNSPTASPFIPNQVFQDTTVGFEQNNTAVQVTPQVENVKEPKMVQPSVKTKKDKSDLKDAAPKPTIVENKTVDASKELLGRYASLKVIDEAIGDQFVKKYETYDENRNYVKVSVYDKNDLVNPIERMGMVVDVNGYVFSNEPKLWSASEVAGKQVDFVPAIRLNKESVVRLLTDKDMLEADDYSFNDGCAELNRFFNVRSMFAFDQIAKDPSLVEPTLKKISDEFKNKKRLKDALGDGRLNMTSFKDPTHFVLETDNNVRSYVGGDPANSPENHVKFVCNGKGISISGK